jgi:hypothetical protein
MLLILLTAIAVTSLLLYIVQKKRFWVIEKLAAGRPVVMNVTMKGGSFHLKPDSDAYFANSTFEGPIDGGALFRVEP